MISEIQEKSIGSLYHDLGFGFAEVYDFTDELSRLIWTTCLRL
jgi:hypothetical protein